MQRYSLDITEENVTGEVDPNVVNVGNGSLKLISYAFNDVQAELGGDLEYRVEVFEIDEAGTRAARATLALSADGDTVRDSLKTRLAKLRKVEKN